MAKSFRPPAWLSKSVSRRLALTALLLPLFTLAEPEIEGASPPPVSTTATDVLLPYSAEYRLHHNGMSADAQRTLSRDRNGGWTLSQKARIFFIKVSEESRIRETESGLEPLSYRYENSLASRRDQHILFDYKNRLVGDSQYRRPYREPLLPDYTDQLSSQLQLRKALIDGSFTDSLTQTIVNGGKIKTYKLEILGEETIDTPVGKLQTVKLRRYREGQDGELLVWLAKDWNYLIVRMEDRDDDDFFLLELLNARIDGKVVGA